MVRTTVTPTQTGLHEMLSCVQQSGGVALQAETFGASHLQASLARLLRTDEDGQLMLAYRASLELRTSKECESVELLGGGESEGGEGEGVAMTEAGDARTFKWKVGALGSHYTAAVAMRRGKETLSNQRDSTLVQLTTTYKHATGATRMRVSTLRLPKPPQKLPVQQLLPGFDQQAAAALLVRQTVKEAAGGAPPPELLQKIDRGLIKTMRALCEYQKGEPSSVSLPPQAGQLPGLVFHLRRSPAVRTTAVSPDETAYFRQLVASLSVFATLVLVQPTLVAYERGRAPAALPLDPAAMVPDRSLILDTFLQVLLCHGSHIAQLRRTTPEDPSLKQLESAARQCVDALEAERFPAPVVYECEQYASKARYLVQKLNPDVPLMTFLQGLYKAIVAA